MSEFPDGEDGVARYLAAYGVPMEVDERVWIFPENVPLPLTQNAAVKYTEPAVTRDGSVVRRVYSANLSRPEDGVTFTWDRVDPELPPDVDERVRADLHDQHVLDRAAAPDPEDIVALMRANGLHDPERDDRPGEHTGSCATDGCPATYRGTSAEDVRRQHAEHWSGDHQRIVEERSRAIAEQRLGLQPRSDDGAD